MKLCLKIAILIFFIPTLVWAKKIRMGGSDTGGGEGVIVQGQLVLKDFVNCSLNKATKFNEFNKDKISSSISKISNQSIIEIIENNPKLEDPIFKKIMQIAAKRSNWYEVDADLYLQNINEEKIAIFKRPIGILISQEKFKQLDNISKNGLIFHETLRMVSIGLGFELDQATLEQLTCEAFNDNDVHLTAKSYPSLNSYIESQLGDYKKMGKSESEAADIFLTHLEMAFNDNLNFLPSIKIENDFFRQDKVSKFENFMNVFPGATEEILESAFFNWASVEAPIMCHSEVECNYFEEWPKERKKIITGLEKWFLVYNDELTQGFRNESNSISFFVSKQSFTRNFCKKISYIAKDNFRLLVPQRDLAITEIYDIDFLFNRMNLDYFDKGSIPSFKRPICVREN